MVSFLHLLNYIKDDEIIQKLVDWGLNPILPLRRRYYPGTTVADGTRFLRVKFPQDIVTLPYNVRLDTEEGPKNFRVIHDGQLKTCRICASTDHEKKGLSSIYLQRMSGTGAFCVGLPSSAVPKL